MADWIDAVERNDLEAAINALAKKGGDPSQKLAQLMQHELTLSTERLARMADLEDQLGKALRNLGFMIELNNGLLKDRKALEQKVRELIFGQISRRPPTTKEYPPQGDMT